MGKLTLHQMKEVRVIVSGENRSFVTELLDSIGATGYTVLAVTEGKGHGGVQNSHFMFGDVESLEMIMTVLPEDAVDPLLTALGKLFDRHSGVMFVSDVAVSRRDYFVKPSGSPT